MLINNEHCHYGLMSRLLQFFSQSHSDSVVWLLTQNLVLLGLLEAQLLNGWRPRGMRSVQPFHKVYSRKLTVTLRKQVSCSSQSKISSQKTDKLKYVIATCHSKGQVSPLIMFFYWSGDENIFNVLFNFYLNITFKRPFSHWRSGLFTIIRGHRYRIRTDKLPPLA